MNERTTTISQSVMTSAPLTSLSPSSKAASLIIIPNAEGAAERRTKRTKTRCLVA